MKDISGRMEKVRELEAALASKKDRFLETAVKDTRFPLSNCRMELDLILERIGGFTEMLEVFEKRSPIAKEGQEVALVLPYNGSAWLNIAIVSIYLVGNRVRVKFASRDSGISAFHEEIYRPIFGDGIKFDYSGGREFFKNAIESENVPALLVFGSDAVGYPYLEDVKRFKKKFVFEGPGKDPFIVLPDANLKAAAEELMVSKYIYAGQTCTAPERVYVHDSIHEEFLKIFLEMSRGVKVGDPWDEEVFMGPVASSQAIENIKTQLADAVSKGAKIALGGDMDGDLVYPTVVTGATHDMLGMREETFGPVSFVMRFHETEEAVRLARDNKYGLRASVYGGREAQSVADRLVGEPYCHEVEDIVFGTFGTVAVNEPRYESWVGAFVTKPVGGYGYSGWIWETRGEEFILKQGAKLLSIESSYEEQA